MNQIKYTMSKLRIGRPNKKVNNIIHLTLYKLHLKVVVDM